MIKSKTPQEWANITGLNIRKLKNGTWIGFIKECVPNPYIEGGINFKDNIYIYLEPGMVDWQGDWKDSLHFP